jgi:serine/threonine-protein kinase RsbW
MSHKVVQGVPGGGGSPFRRRFVVTGSREDLEQLQRSVLGAVEEMQYGAASTFAIRLALEEALSNAFKHGNKSDPGKTVTVHCHVDSDEVALEIEDQGEGFDPSCIPDPTQRENIEIPCGRGIVLMRSFMTEVRFEPPGNRVRMWYRKGRD